MSFFGLVAMSLSGSIGARRGCAVSGRRIRANAMEGAAVIFTVTCSGAAAAAVKWNTAADTVYDKDYMGLDTTRLEFTPSDWDEPQAVTATAMGKGDSAAAKHAMTVIHTGKSFDRVHELPDVRRAQHAWEEEREG